MKKPFRTKDLSEAAFLYASGKKLISVQSDNNRRYFIFEGYVPCTELADSYWRKEAMVNAKEYADALLAILGDKERRKTMARESQKRFDTLFSLDGMIQEYEKLFNNIMRDYNE